MLIFTISVRGRERKTELLLLYRERAPLSPLAYTTSSRASLSGQH